MQSLIPAVSHASFRVYCLSVVLRTWEASLGNGKTGWKSTLRSIQATSRRLERERQRSLREQERQQRAYEKQVELEVASQEVSEYEQYMAHITSLRTFCSNPIPWERLIEAALSANIG